MRHLILGYGYSGFYLAKHLIQLQQNVLAVSRHDGIRQLDTLDYLQQDILTKPLSVNKKTIVYYLIPPGQQGQQDESLALFLKQMQGIPCKLVYFSSSGVYGDHQGAALDEKSPCVLQYDRQYRRLDAEQQCQRACQEKGIDCLILRVAGIYGPYRLPNSAASQQKPLIHPSQAPFTNSIYVKDLAAITALLALKKEAIGIVNVADGNPAPMGTLQQLVAQKMKLPPAPFHDFASAWAEANPMKKEFLSASKKLSTTRLKTLLGDLWQLQSLESGIMDALSDEAMQLSPYAR